MKAVLIFTLKVSRSYQMPNTPEQLRQLTCLQTFFLRRVESRLLPMRLGMAIQVHCSYLAAVEPFIRSNLLPQSAIARQDIAKSLAGAALVVFDCPCFDETSALQPRLEPMTIQTFVAPLSVRERVGMGLNPFHFGRRTPRTLIAPNKNASVSDPSRSDASRRDARTSSFAEDQANELPIEHHLA